MSRIAITLALILSCLVAVGCSRLADRSKKSYETVVTGSNRDAEQARADCQRAAAFFDQGNLAKAETALQDALIADVSYAPAHNNLGRIYFDQGNLYLAAWEFEYARRLLPDSADVVNNLGMVYEAAGQEERAIENYSLALSMDMGNPVYTGNLARALLRADKDPAQAAVLLQELALSDTRTEWTAWAKEQLKLRQDVRAAAHAQPPQPAEKQVPEVVEPLPVPGQLEGLENPQIPLMPLLNHVGDDQ